MIICWRVFVAAGSMLILFGSCTQRSFRQSDLAAHSRFITEDNEAIRLSNALISSNAQTSVSYIILTELLPKMGYSLSSSEGSRATFSRAQGNGIPYTDDEIRALASLTNFGAGLSLSQLGTALQGIPSLEEAPLSRLVVDDLRDALGSSDPAISYWARAWFNLGDQTRILLSVPTKLSADTVLNGLQVELLLRKIVSDLVIAAASSNEADHRRPSSASLVRLMLVDSRTSSGCKFDKIEERIVKSVQATEVYAFKGLLKYLRGVGVVAAGTYLTVLKIAQPILDYAKFFYALAALEADITVDGVIERRRDAGPGRTHQVTATLRYGHNDGPAEALNCLQMVFATAGLKVNLPQGPVANAAVDWIGMEGFGSAAADQFLEAAAKGNVGSELPDILVEFVGRPDHRVTDDTGSVRIGVRGAGQRRHVASAARELSKSARLEVAIALSKASLWNDLQAAGKVVGFNFISVPLQMLSRTSLTFFSRKLDVRDWGSPEYRFGPISAGYFSTYTQRRSTRLSLNIHEGRICMTNSLTDYPIIVYRALVVRQGNFLPEAPASYETYAVCFPYGAAANTFECHDGVVPPGLAVGYETQQDFTFSGGQSAKFEMVSSGPQQPMLSQEVSPSVEVPLEPADDCDDFIRETIGFPMSFGDPLKTTLPRDATLGLLPKNIVPVAPMQ